MAKLDVQHAAEIMARYARIPGITPAEVRARVRRHASMLSALDPGVAMALGELRAGEAVALARSEARCKPSRSLLVVRRPERRLPV